MGMVYIHYRTLWIQSTSLLPASSIGLTTSSADACSASTLSIHPMSHADAVRPWTAVHTLRKSAHAEGVVSEYTVCQYAFHRIAQKS